MKQIKVSKMSFGQDLNTYIDDTIRKYIKLISTKHSLDYEELLSDWVGGKERTPRPTPTVVVPTPRPTTPKKVLGVVETKDEGDTTDSLMKLTKQELQDRCKKAGVRSSGTKNDLVKYLVENKAQTKIKTISTKAPPPFVQQIQQEEKKREEEKVMNPIVRKITSTVPTFNIRRNKFNNYEDINTGFVFDNLSKKVIGKQSPDGTVLELTKEDINICNKYKFQFVLPTNLDKNTKVEDVKVEELEEDDGEGDEEIVEEEVEVEGEVEGDIGDIVDDEEVDEDVIDEDEDEILEEEEDVIEDDE